MKKDKLTMNDIAKMAGVAKSTVSRYFNGGYVKEDTRFKIKKVVDEYHYEPNTLAKSMKAKHTKTIGIITPCLDSITASRVLMTIDEYLKNHGYDTLIVNTNHNELRELTSIERLWKMNVDGIILSATTITMAHHQLAAKLDIPMLFVGQLFKNGISIINDDYHAGYDIGQYVRSMNHQDILYLGVSGKDEAVGIERKKGVLAALQEDPKVHVSVLETDFTYERTRKVIGDYLTTHVPTMIICATDNLAFACYKEIQERGLHIPDDISVSGFGGYEVSSLVVPSLCTIRFDNELTGNMAGKTMLQLIDQESVAPIQTIGYTLIEGQSVIKRGI